MNQPAEERSDNPPDRISDVPQQDRNSPFGKPFGKLISGTEAPSILGAGIDSETPASGQVRPAAAFPKIISFDSLARCGDEIWIENNGQIYRLRKTKQGKLILTK